MLIKRRLELGVATQSDRRNTRCSIEMKRSRTQRSKGCSFDGGLRMGRRRIIAATTVRAVSSLPGAPRVRAIAETSGRIKVVCNGDAPVR